MMRCYHYTLCRCCYHRSHGVACDTDQIECIRFGLCRRLHHAIAAGSMSNNRPLMDVDSLTALKKNGDTVVYPPLATVALNPDPGEKNCKEPHL